MLNTGLALSLSRRLNSASIYALAGIEPSLVLDTELDFFKVGTSQSGFNQGLTVATSTASTVLDSDGDLKWAPHNQILYSSSVLNASWVATNTTKAASGTDIFGNDAFTITEDTSTGEHNITPASGDRPAVTSGNTYTFGYIVQDVDMGYCMIRSNAGAVSSGSFDNSVYNLTSGSVQNSGSGHNAAISSLGSGYYLVTITPTLQWTGTAIVTIQGSNGTTSQSYTGTEKAIKVSAARFYRSDLGGMQSTGDATDPTYVPTEGTAVYYAGTQHDAAGSVLGAQLEPQATNKLQHSHAFDQSAWTKSNTTVTSGSVNSPLGASTGWALETNATSSASYTLRQDLTVTSGQECHWVLAKANDYNHLVIRLNVASSWINATFNLSTGSTGTVAGGYDDADMIDYGDGWYLCYVVTTNRTAVQIQWIISDADNADSHTPSATGLGIYIAAAQTEDGSYPTSYIPTNGATVTRTATDVSVATADFADDLTEIVVVAEYSARDNDDSNRVYQIDDGTANQRLRYYAAGSWTAQARDGGVNQATMADETFAANTVARSATRFAADDFATSQDGGSALTDTSGTMPTVTTLRLGRQTSGNHLNGFLRYIAVYAAADLSAITNAELETASTQS